MNSNIGIYRNPYNWHSSLPVKSNSITSRQLKEGDKLKGRGTDSRYWKHLLCRFTQLIYLIFTQSCTENKASTKITVHGWKSLYSVLTTNNYQDSDDHGSLVFMKSSQRGRRYASHFRSQNFNLPKVLKTLHTPGTREETFPLETASVRFFGIIKK